jgi:hypothetical protein
MFFNSQRPAGRISIPEPINIILYESHIGQKTNGVESAINNNKNKIRDIEKKVDGINLKAPAY